MAHKETFVFQIGDTVECVNIDPLPYDKHHRTCPKLKLGEEYPIKTIAYDSQGNQHLDVGLESSMNYIRSFETRENLPCGDKIHWCHPSRFILKKRKTKEED